MKINPCFIFLALLPCLTGCEHEQTSNNKNKTSINVEDFTSIEGEFSIGLKERKIVPFFYSNIFSELKNNDPYYLASRVKISFISNDNVNSFIDAEIDSDSNIYEYNISSCQNQITFYCKEKFDSPLKLEKLQFETDDYCYVMDFNVTLVFNPEYEDYPLFLPTYDQNGVNWNSKIVFGNRLAFNFERYYDLSIDRIIINNISFSQIFNEKVRDISFSIIDKNVELDFFTNGLYDDDRFVFQNFREINYSKECGIDKALLCNVSYSVEKSNKTFYGDIIMDVTINGLNFKIKDLFIF